jgi:hypothetical protein
LIQITTNRHTDNTTIAARVRVISAPPHSI